MKTINIKLMIDGKEVTLGHQFLEDIVNEIPDIPQNKKIFEVISKSDNNEVRRLVTKKKFLNKKTIHSLLNDSSKTVITNLFYNKNIAKRITKKQIMKIIKTNEKKFLSTIATHLKKFSLINKCKFAKKLSKHPDPSVRYNLIANSEPESITISVLKKLTKDEDPIVALKAKSRLAKRLTTNLDCDCTTEICFCNF